MADDLPGLDLQTASRDELLEEIHRLREELRVDDEHNTFEDLPEAHEEMEHLAHFVGHDLRAPLRHIASFIQLLSDESATAEEREEWMGYVRRGAIRMRRMIDDLLAYVRLGRVPVLATRVDVGEAAQIAASVVVVDGELDVELGMLGDARANASLLETVFQNLLENSLRYSGDRHAKVVLRREDAGGFVRILVSDNGFGVREDERERIFIPFQRGTLGTRVEGSGLGLSLSRRMMRQIGGDIRLEHSSTEGSTFVLILQPAD